MMKRRRHLTRPSLEGLEDRLLPAIDNFIGGFSHDSWFDPQNWSDRRQLFLPIVLPHGKMLPCKASHDTSVGQRLSSAFCRGRQDLPPVTAVQY
jgi:hypothetical protein